MVKLIKYAEPLAIVSVTIPLLYSFQRLQGNPLLQDLAATNDLYRHYHSLVLSLISSMAVQCAHGRVQGALITCRFMTKFGWQSKIDAGQV